jgi:multidrug efflux pump subunit AcrA (membrane-fusion protein)
VRKAIKLFIPVLILAAGFSAFQALKATRPEQSLPEIKERVWRVGFEEIVPAVSSPVLVLYGRVQTADMLRVAASAQARVAAVPVRDGERVAAGGLLARLDEADLLPSLHRAKARVAELEAEIRSEQNRYETDLTALEQEKKLLALAKDGVDRAQRLTKQRVGSESDLDSAEETLARQTLAVRSREMNIDNHPARRTALEARLASARAGLEEIELELNRSVVHAPYDGIVTDVSVTEGDQVKKDEVLLRFYALDSLEVRAGIPAPHQEEVRAALESGDGLEAVAELDGQRLGLRLVRLAGEADPSGIDGLFKVEGDPGLLRLGQMLTLLLVRPEQENAVALPFQAVYDGDRIYRVEDGRMRGLRVETLGAVVDERGKERLLVRSPELAAGDRVVITHMPNAVDGLLVELVE